MNNSPSERGYLLDQLGYLDELETAAALGLTAATLVEYRKRRIGPPHVELARKIYYGRDAVAAWLAAGGTRSDAA